ncbi:MAG TPA: hypothetical protein VGL71_06590 [Urbifossiella sp.]|jgi:hypothetical protein
MKYVLAFQYLFWSSIAFAQSGQVIPSVSLHPDKIALADSVQVTLALEGPSPLRFEVPKETEKLLTLNSAAVWQIRPAGSPRITMLEGGRERWEQQFRLSPFAPGEKVIMAFAPLKVTAGNQRNPQEIIFPSQEVRVQTAITEPNAEDARPITGLEELPPVPQAPPDSVVWQFVGILAAIFAAGAIAGMIRKYRATLPPLPPGSWARREFDKLERDSALERIGGAEAADRLAAILREFLERHSGVPAPKLTTAELLTACTDASWPAERMAPLREILESCDRAKFAGIVPDSAQMTMLINQSRQWIGSFGEASSSSP